jgi:pimeloyl-ACP methyl ester carboxylesterase
MKEGEKYFKSLNYEEIIVSSFDNLKLHAYFYENPNSKGTVIFMHGYHGSPLNDFGPVIKKFKEMGYSSLLPYQRTHGKSQGKYITFGVKESKDCLTWAKYIANRYPNRSIALHRISLGGASVGMASCFEDLPKEVRNEPKLALDGGPDGLYFYRKIAETARKFLNEEGTIAVEIGYNQKEDVIRIFEENQYKEIYCRKDFGGNDRIIVAKV